MERPVAASTALIQVEGAVRTSPLATWKPLRASAERHPLLDNIETLLRLPEKPCYSKALPTKSMGTVRLPACFVGGGAPRTSARSIQMTREYYVRPRLEQTFLRPTRDIDALMIVTGTLLVWGQDMDGPLENEGKLLLSPETATVQWYPGTVGK